MIKIQYLPDSWQVDRKQKMRFMLCLKEAWRQKSDFLNASSHHKMNKWPLLFIHRRKDLGVLKNNSCSLFWFNSKLYQVAIKSNLIKKLTEIGKKRMQLQASQIVFFFFLMNTALCLIESSNMFIRKFKYYDFKKHFPFRIN